jgi:hypothetical protein
LDGIIESSPETTLQAEDRCHRPGQEKDVHVDYILSQGTVEEEMWELINAKAAAQRAVFDKEALYKSVEEVMAEAVSAQMEVARRMIEVEREPLNVEAAADAGGEEAGPAKKREGQLTMFDLFQRHGRQPKRGRKRSTRSAAPQQLGLFGSGQVASA